MRSALLSAVTVVTVGCASASSASDMYEPAGRGGGSSQGGPSPQGAGGAGSGSAGSPGAHPSGTVCKQLAAGDCNPVLTTPCKGPGSACDLGDAGGFTCFDPPNTLKIGAACSQDGADFCSAGSTCHGGACTRFCCTDTDCNGGRCVALDALPVGVCQKDGGGPTGGGAPTGAGGGGPAGAGGSGPVGAGAGPMGAGAGPTGAGGGPAGVGGTGAGAGPNGAGAGPSGTGGGGPTMDYPSGPYGWTQGKVAPNVTFSGYLGGKAPWTKIAMKDYFDPTGAKGVRALYIPIFAQWCGACQDESSYLPPIVKKYEAKGARFLAILASANDGGPANKSTVDAWISQYAFQFDFGVESTDLGEAYYPFHILIDPRTMKVVEADACPADDSMPCIDNLLAKNP